MSGRHAKTILALQKTPVQANLNWQDIESALLSVGAVLTEGSGSRVRFDLNGVTLSAHRPHPQKEAKRYQVKDVLDFLIRTGVVK